MVQSIPGTRLPKLDFSAFAQVSDQDLHKEKSSPFVTLIETAVSDPADIDSLLPSYLALDTARPSVTPAVEALGHSTLASHLSELLFPDTSSCTTPPIFWVASADAELSEGIHPRFYSWDASECEPLSFWNPLRIHATLLGRALTLTHDSTNAGPSSNTQNEKNFAELWDNPEPAAGLLILTCSTALRDHKGGVKGKGKHWVWYNDEIEEPDTEWSWDDLKQAILDTERSVPQNNTDFNALVRLRDEQAEGPNRLGWGSENQPPEYVSKEAVEMLQLAREHLVSERDDWTSEEMMALAQREV
ncbi:MAG: hypothetical protein M1835_001423 [Candelina submexicana]|nr:MAG: hypothetical protein M1835_001423 [Candelina submexicana]